MISDPPRKSINKEIFTANIKVYAKNKEILDVSFGLGEGEIVAMMGQNGAGKTTILKGISGMLDPSEYKVYGSIKYMEEELSNKPIWYRGKYMVYLPQTFDLMLVTSQVKKEIEYTLKHRKVKNYHEIAERYMKEFGLFEYKDQDPVILSMGQRRRVAMASILASGVKIMLMDEPTSGQDFYNKMMLGKELKDLASKGYTILIVTHDSRFVYEYADRLLIIDHGKKVLEGKPEEVFKESSKYGIYPPTDFLLRW
nr:ABC transporter ATP-binding protein [Acidianus brierleyi]